MDLNVTLSDKYSSVQRSMDIFWRLTNLSMEWKGYVFLSSFVKDADQDEYWREMHKKMAVSILDSIKSLKGCWVKLGQLLSTKSGLLPRCYLDTFSQLQEDMTCSDFSEVIDTLEAELGYMDDLYRNFDSIPIASASIGQVHKATLMNDTKVAVKVQHKSSEQNMRNDLEILKMITWMIRVAGQYKHIYDYVDEYSSEAAKELDFNIELDNMINAYKDVISSSVPIKVPRAYPEYCSGRVITMEYLDLHKIDCKTFMDENEIDAESILYDIHDFAFYQALTCGRFHGDPHPGNLQLTYDYVENKYYPVFLDWGLMQNLSTRQRLALCKLYESLYNGDTVGCVASFAQAGFDLKECSAFEYDRFLRSLLRMFTTNFSTIAEACSCDAVNEERIEDAILGQHTQAFVKEFITNAPKFVPLSLKVISEYRNIAARLNVEVPLLQLLYKNATYALHKLYDNPLWAYLNYSVGMSTLYRKMVRIAAYLNRNGKKISLINIINGITKDVNSIRNTNVYLTRELKFHAPKNVTEAKIASLLKYLSTDKNLIVAGQIAVIRNGYVEVNLSFGNIGKFENRPVTSVCLFPALSLMPGLLTTAILYLATIGKLDIDDTVSKYWPKFMKNGKERITIREILNNTSGLIHAYPSIPLLENVINYEVMCSNIENTFLHREETDMVHYSFIYIGWILAELARCAAGETIEGLLVKLFSKVGIPHDQFVFPSFSMDPNRHSGLLDDNDSLKTLLFNEKNNTHDSGSDLMGKDCHKIEETVVNVADMQTTILGLFSRDSKSSEVDNNQYYNGISIPAFFLDKIIPKAAVSSIKSNETSKSEKKLLNCTDTSPPEFGIPLNNQEKNQINETDVSHESRQVMTIRDFLSLKEPSNQPASRNALNIKNGDDYKYDPKLMRGYIKRLLSNIPDNGETEQLYSSVVPCRCSNRGNQFDNEYKRCLVPSEWCPLENRFVKVFRRPLINSSYATDGFNSGEKPNACHPHKSRGIINPLICEVPPDGSTDNEEKGNQCTCPILTRIRRKHTVQNTKAAAENIFYAKDERQIHFTTYDVLRHGCIMVDPINLDYEQVYKKSLPALNGRITALALAKFYQGILNGALVDRRFVQESIRNGYVDESPVSRFMCGFHNPCWSLGYQKFEFKSTENSVSTFAGLGNADIGGSVAFCIPEYNLSITLLLSHQSSQAVSLKILQFILMQYGLQLIGNGLCTAKPDHTYQLLSAVRI